jgi:hypothetical protein
MSVATTTAIAIGATAVAAGGVASSIIGANAAESAAQTQANSEQSAINLQQQEWQKQQANEAPFLQTGESALPQLEADVNNPNFSKYPGGAFQAPTAAQAEQYPGEQFQLSQGAQAIDENAAATGNLQSGTTGEALENYGQGLAQTDYGNVYNQALQQYMTNYGVWNQDTTNQVNRLQTLANLGSNTAAQLGQQGEAAAQTQGNELVGQGTALASGTVGAANAITSGIGGITNFASSLPLYSLLGQQQQNLNASSYGNQPYTGGLQPYQTPQTGIGPTEYAPAG